MNLTKHTYQNDFVKNFVKFKLFKNSKRPTQEWLLENRDSLDNKGAYCPNLYNTAIPTGTLNNITVLDLDLYKDGDKNIFIKEFGKNFINFFNTLTVRTPKGGYHLYFKYDSDIRTTTSKYNIDIRNNGGYVVAPPSVINNKNYEIVNNDEIKPIPLKLKEWLFNNIYNNFLNKNNKKNATIKNESRELTRVKFDIQDDKIIHIIKNINNDYLNDYTKWFKFSTFCKFFNKRKLWCEMSKKSKKFNIIYRGIFKAVAILTYTN